MACKIFQAEKDLSCSICHDIFDNPVVLSCSHSFCKLCLQQWWTHKVILECPICKRRSSKSDPPCNLVLKNLCEALSQETLSRPEDLCGLHSEILKLFCMNHQEPVCVVCRDSKAHAFHSFKPVDEAAQDHRRELRICLKPLRDKLEHLRQAKVVWCHAARKIKIQARQTERVIEKQFEELHQFLQREEELRLAALKEEMEQKSQLMRARIEEFSREMSALTETIRATEEQLRAEDVPFLQNFSAAVERLRQHPLLVDSRLASGSLIHSVKHMGNLGFNIWSKMKDIVSYSPVILDPNTAEPHVKLNQDLDTVTYVHQENKTRPKNPERFEDYVTVVGSEGFDSGTHSWDIEVVDNENWAVGVIGESAQRNAGMQTGCWSIRFHDGKYRVFSPSVRDKVLVVKKPLQRIRVQLDCGRQKVTFYDPDTNASLYSFSKTSSEKLFPFINTLHTVPLKIAPLKVSIKLEP